MATMAMATPAKAQENAGSTPRQWTLEECISYALENNISLKQTRLSIEQNDINVSQAQGGLFPSLSFSTNHNLSWRPWSQTTVHLESGTMTTTNKDVTYNGSYGLNANWTVWDGGRKYKQVGRYKLNSEMSSYEEQETANSIQEQITQYYVQILYQTEAIKVNEQILASSLQQRDRAKEMVEAGSLARVDLAQIEAQAGQDEYNVVNAKTQLANYKLQLKQILEIIGTEEFDVVIPTTRQRRCLRKSRRNATRDKKQPTQHRRRRLRHKHCTPWLLPHPRTNSRCQHQPLLKFRRQFRHASQTQPKQLCRRKPLCANTRRTQQPHKPAKSKTHAPTKRAATAQHTKRTIPPSRKLLAASPSRTTTIHSRTKKPGKHGRKLRARERTIQPRPEKHRRAEHRPQQSPPSRATTAPKQIHRPAKHRNATLLLRRWHKTMKKKN